MNKTVIIVGGGASGMICAIKIKQMNPSINVMIIEKNERIGKKILKTGNGRCNLGNRDISAAYYNNPVFLEKCLFKHSFEDIIKFFEGLGLLTKEDDSGRIYPNSEMATTVLDVIRRSLLNADVKIECGVNVCSVKKEEDHFIISSDDRTFTAGYVVLACGSLAQANTNGYDLAKNLGHSITCLRPGLVPLKTERNYRNLNGLRVKCRASIVSDKSVIHKEYGEILFKNDGISGILSLNLSRFAKRGSRILLDFVDAVEVKSLQTIFRLYPGDELLGIIPKMLSLDISKIAKKPEEILRTIKNYPINIIDTYDFNYAQITLGGVKTEDVSECFSSRYIENLYIIGEMLDIDGPCGGYNLFFAWISGIIAAESIAFEK